jgi:DUF971 family protein
MQPTSIKRSNETTLSIMWDDGAQFTVPLELLRDRCPCALCAGETLLLGKHVQGQPGPILPGRNELGALKPVGTYALGAEWRDGHNTGLYTFEHLRAVCEEAARTT